ncbi:predicted E3 ubiquitin ligase [Moesziomyces antarcticus T-34]|uniref:E3 ubiquitin-protein ligase listerin n=1 Tax=Pseudozyma antarctica (strain T-34) TaxID=1151754 RepID=M9MCU4_PSEA3|nr:predicted E3 ubiquitin ligase [Moesziomyces antarcticus T-34]
MAKGAPKGKSSASSATRKKQAAKAANKKAYERDDDGNLLHPELAEAMEKQKQHGMQRGQKKDKSKKDGKVGKKGKADKKKQYIPPPKPPQPLPDPLDSMGLASLLPADLVVLLRKASKKDVITRCRALEGLLAWVEDAFGKTAAAAGSDATEASRLTSEEKKEALVMMLPSWVHLFPRLALSPTRRLRLLTMQIQTLLLENSSEPSSDDTTSTRSELLESPQYIEAMLGPWAILCHDTDRSIERLGRAAWLDTCTWKDVVTSEASAGAPEAVKLDLNEHSETLMAHLRTILLSTSPSYALSMTAAHAVAASDPSMSRTSSGQATPQLGAGVERDAKNRDDSNVEEDTAALDKRLVAGALAVLTAIIRQKPGQDVVDALDDVLSSRLVWASLSPQNLASSAASRSGPQARVTSFGFDSPAVRLRAWTLLRALFDSVPDTVDKHLQTIGPVALTSVWQERDNAVQRTMLEAALPLLKKRPELWLLGTASAARSGGSPQNPHKEDSESDEDDSDEDDDEDADADETNSDADAGGEEGKGNGVSTSRPVPRAYTSFLQWLQSACGGAPTLGYPAVIVFISTIPAQVLPYDDLDAASDLLSQFFSALYSRALDFDPTGCRAFLASFVECVSFLSQRMARQSSASDKDAATSAKELVRIHFGAAWNELLLPKKSLLAALGIATDADEGDEDARAQRIKSIGSTRIVSDLAVQVRRLASAAPDLQLLGSFLEEAQSDVASIVQALSQAPADVSPPAQARLLISLERATSFYAALAPADAQSASGELRRASASSLGSFAKLASSSLADIAADTDMPHDFKRTRATLLTEFLCLLLRAVVSFPDALDSSASEQLAQIAGVSIPQLTTIKSVAPAPAATFLAAYLPLCKDEHTRASIWTETLSSVAALSELSDQVDAMTELVAASAAVGKSIEADTSSGAQLPVPPPDAGIEDLVMELIISLCDGSSLPDELRHRLKRVVAAILARPSPFVNQASSQSMLSMVTSTIEQLRWTLLERAQPNTDVAVRQQKAAIVVEDLLDCLDAWRQAQPKEDVAQLLLSRAASKGVIAALSDLFALHTASKDDGELFEQEWTEKERAFAGLWRKARNLHQQITQNASPQLQKQMREEALTSLQEHLLDIQVPVVRIVAAADYDVAVLPEPKELAEMMAKACKQRTHPALLVFDPLVPQDAVSDSTSTAFDRLFDQQGLGIFARVGLAALLMTERDRANARRHLDLLPLVVMFSILIEDDLLLPGASKHALESAAAPTAHRAWLQHAVTVITALVSSLSDTVTENWHNDMVASLQRSTIVDMDKDGIGHVLSKLWQTAAGLEVSSAYLARIFHRLLNAVFSFGTVTEAGADRWLKLGDAVQDRMPAMTAAVFHAAKSIAGLSPGYDRLRNGAAAKLSGSAPDRVLRSLQVLVALAPPVNSELSIIPQQRAIFLLKDLQKWYTSEDADSEPEEEASTRLAELFVHLLPVVQDVQGSHIDFVFDVLETNLEFCSLEQDETVAQLYHTLQLLDVMRDLASRNANLREYWKERSTGCIELVRELFLSLAQQQAVSAPKQACIDLVVELIRETSEAPFKLHETAPALCKLMVQSASHEVQVLSFRLLTAAVREHVKELVVESAVDREALASEEGQQKLKLPAALVANVSDSLSSQLNLLVEEDAARRTAFGYFLSWIALFEHFENASLSVKSTFLGEIESRQLLVDSLLPTVFALVGLADESRRPFDPSRFVLEEVFLDEMDAESSLTVLQVLAAHVYLRALIHVPTTVRSWWVNIKDRQHSMQIASFTTRHCSPVIANRELSHLREPEALAKLQDEALSIKILSTNEVIATYVVDEHPMEIGVKIPADFPLHGVEIRDIQRVGITEAKWRSWLLAVQQLITGQNGLIFDALSLFKRNAEVQFQGLDECAICYSIISPMDRSLPTKPCKTCKNKFHAGCLFKWISTSGASTCPLCRSIL